MQNFDKKFYLPPHPRRGLPLPLPSLATAFFSKSGKRPRRPHPDLTRPPPLLPGPLTARPPSPPPTPPASLGRPLLSLLELGKKRVVGTLAAVPRRRRRRGTGYLTAAAGGGARAGEGENTPGCCLVFLYKKKCWFYEPPWTLI